LEIKRIINSPVSSNCFIVSFKDDSCILIDPGSKDTSIIENSIRKKTIDYIFLTHEHFDHIWSADTIKKKFNAKLCCSIEASKAIVDKKKNFSIFYDQIGFELSSPDIILKDRQIINWKEQSIEIIYTPGHSNGSVCIKINKCLFTGDTIIKNTPTITKLPGGSKRKLQESMEKLILLGLHKLDLYCGHGENDIK